MKEQENMLPKETFLFRYIKFLLQGARRFLQ